MSTLIKGMASSIDSLLPELEAIYKDLHQHPELSMQEVPYRGDRCRLRGKARLRSDAQRRRDRRGGRCCATATGRP